MHRRHDLVKQAASAREGRGNGDGVIGQGFG